MKPKVIYYSDPLNDDFANNNIKTKEIPGDFKYVHTNPVYRFFEFILYSVIVRPLVFLYVKVKYLQRFHGKKKVRGYKEGYFLYGNHTNGEADAFIPSMFTFPKKDYIVAGPDAFSIKGIKTIVQMLGGIPLAGGFSHTKKLLDCIKKRVNDGNVIVIYPEAHIWPYYNSIRPFKESSFCYPYILKKGVFCFVNVYKKRRFFKKPKIETYIEGPFFADYSLPRGEAIKKLRDEVYETMVRITNEHSDYEYIKYVYRENRT